MSVKTSPRRTARLAARRTPCYLGGQLHSRKAGSDTCRDCGTARPTTQKA